MTDTRIRLLQEDDWDELVTLEERAYAASGLSEGEAALRSRYRASPSTCFVLEHAGGFGGYLLALPYPLFRCPDLSLAEEGAAQGSNLHLHDLVIAERARGRGLAHRMQEHLEETGRAATYQTLSLVAVNGSQVLWTTLGYRTQPGIGLPASYGAEAVYMTKPLEIAVTSRLSGSLPEPKRADADVPVPGVFRRSRPATRALSFLSGFPYATRASG
ncbi:GNAT family N-acetyltransferase [Streptomyces sp. NBC_00094]|uniref:GNAT family N-acetyltransferase n=1 Tax=Streptomyces sp. NBC_00094 TaxID=2903620 RepID=UPI00225AB39D|nr:GNAT family N-acetyltransferase [Streptomyces sp. NBC_00094]MCX5389105.1 GNAT family N-acetyltransferase [Streptomyces sp. NBC_00094]